MSFSWVKIGFIIVTSKCCGQEVRSGDVREAVIGVGFSVKRVMALWAESTTFVVYL